QLALAKNSYWFYKANLFILLVEFANLEESNIQYSTLESSLLELEKKADIYFNDDDDISMITEDERKYFEVARQGSNELGAREHRGKVIREIVSNSLKTSAVFEGANVEQNLHYLRAKGEDFAIIKPTETGLRKSIMDAVSSVRYFLKRNNIHDYDNQEFGPDNKVIKEGKFIDGTGDHRTTNISFYRSNNRGDCRIWFTELNSFANASDELALLNLNGAIAILNLSRYNYTSVFN
ncbi:MAG TPA: hypothetical protein VHB70_01640, partial [Parafilimonas sp.]|nr:hypothetical protein [Parafilimonas sp.]